ncbi:Uncharacterised protein [Escherichia coli]|nr:Uncharacterised protein [Escherichia coli]SQL83437.1 Uncharacterised protein [Escherichia coli]SQS25810.1 Uncharacterised protein [Escherichia coli]
MTFSNRSDYKTEHILTTMRKRLMFTTAPFRFLAH